MTKTAQKPFYAATGQRYIGVPHFLLDLVATRQISQGSFMLAVFLCSVANFETGEVVVKSIGFMANSLNTYSSNIAQHLNQLEEVKFLLRDSGATTRVLNRYKLFNDPSEWHDSYEFVSSVPASNKAAKTTAPKAAGATAVPKPIKPASQASAKMYISHAVVVENFDEDFNFYLSPPRHYAILDYSASDTANKYFLEVDATTFKSLSKDADERNLPFPAKFKANTFFTYADFKGLPNPEEHEFLLEEMGLKHAEDDVDLSQIY